jgi:NAD/NADP transhydrogenase beta subunit
MTFAITFTFLLDAFADEFVKFIPSFALGGVIGLLMAVKVEMINMP